MGIRDMRLNAGYSIQELAQMAGVSTHTILHLEQGKTVPQPRTLRKLATALGVRVKDLREETATYLVAGQRVPEGFVATLVKAS
ncbi:MAG: helix-turn-helix domain-containing protein [Actinomycetota bacterium]|nr:helix-turn-helix domain-containing protein [Actinomycetota bacterium]